MGQRLPTVAEPARLSPDKRRVFVLLLLAAGLALLASSADLHAWLLGFLPAAEAVIKDRPVLGVVTFVLFAALSAILVMVAYHMSEWRAFRAQLRAPRSDVVSSSEGMRVS